MIWEYSQGIPRKINILCDNALLIAYGIEQKKISQEIIQEAINDLSWSPFLDKPRSQTSLAGNTHAFSLEQEEQAAQKQRLSNSEGTPPIASDEIQTPSFKESANNKAEEINTPDPGEIPEPISVDFQAPNSEDPFLPVSTEIRHSHEFDVSEEVSRKMFNRIRLSFIAGILLLLCLIIGAWLFFTQSISSSDQNLFSSLEIVQTEARALLSDSLDSNTGKVEPLIIEHPRASLREDSEEILR